MEIKQRFVLGAPAPAAGTTGVDIAADNISATNVTTTNLAATNITVSGSTTASGFINVRDYGATGNGTTDDTANIQSALNAANTAGGATVYFPKGTYKITNLLALYSYTSVVGDGPGSVIQQVTNYTAGLQAVSGAHDIAIRNLALLGSYTHTTFPNGSTAVMFYSVNTTAIATGDMSDVNFAGNRLTLENCVIQNWGQNGCGGTAGTKILNNRFINIYGEPIIIAGDDCLIQGNYINGAGSWAIDNNASHTRIFDNLIYNVNQAVTDPAILTDGGGIIIANVNRTDGLRDIHVEGNTIDTSQSAGILVYAPNGGAQFLAYVTVANNIVRNCYVTPNTSSPYLGGAIFISNSSGHTDYPVHNVIVSGNVIENTFGKGIEVIACRYVDVVNNNISNVRGTTTTSDGFGIRIFPHIGPVNTDISVQGNNISGFDNTGIWVQSLTGTSARIHVSGNTISNPVGTLVNTPLIELVNVNEFIVSDNSIQGRTTPADIGMQLQSAVGGTISGNYISGTSFGVTLQAGVTDVAILGNNVRGVTVGRGVFYAAALVRTFTRSNIGYNPLGTMVTHIGNPAVPATGVAYQNNLGVDCLVSITAPVNPAPDGVTAIYLSSPDGNGSNPLWPDSIGIVLSAHQSITCVVPALYSITMNYTIAPTWLWFGN